MKLISMTDFVLEQSNNENLSKELLKDDGKEFMRIWGKIFSYANFLKQPLEIWMFVPCKLVDGVWVFLEEPKLVYDKEDVMGVYNGIFQNHNQYLDEYQQAKERCLFDGFEFTESQKYSIKNGIQNSIHWYTKNRLYLTTKKEDSYRSYFQLYTIEDLIQCDLKLTPTAQKQIGCAP